MKTAHFASACFVDHHAIMAMPDVQTGLQTYLRRHADAVRIHDRQERMVEAINWDMLTSEDIFEVRIREDELSGDVFHASIQLDYFRALSDSGYTDARQQIGWDPTRPFSIARASDGRAPLQQEDPVDDLPF